MVRFRPATASPADLDALSGTYVSEDEADALWVPANRFTTHAGTPALSSFAIGYPAFLMDAASDEQVSGSFLVPEWFTTVNVQLVWANAGVGAGDVAWRVVYTQNSGPAASFNAGAVAPTGVTATAAGQYVRTDTQVVAGAAVTGKLWGFRAWRDADAVADTLANDAAFVGLLVERAS